MSMQMDAYLKKEQIGTLFVLVGAPEGGFRGGSPSGVSTPKSKKTSCVMVRNCADQCLAL